MSVVFASSSVIVSLLTFSIYVTIGNGVLTPKVVFVSMTLFDQLHTPLTRLAEATTETIGLIVATKRIQRFLLREEIDNTQVIRDKYNKDNDENVIEIKDAVMSWTSGNPIKEKDEDEDEDIDEESEQTNGEHADENDRLLSEQQHQPQPTLRNINLNIKDKSLTAVVGRVGQGKSSLL
ncbi:Multidrug resistance-associated protein 4, partial [Mortierella sp. NVP85]